MSDKIIHKFAEGKYTVIYEGGRLRAERHGTPWRSLTGDSMVLAMLQQYDDLVTVSRQLAEQLEGLPQLAADLESAAIEGKAEWKAIKDLLHWLTKPEAGLMPDVLAKVVKALPVPATEEEKYYHDRGDEEQLAMAVERRKERGTL